MQKQRNFYLIYIQYLGFRYSGWQKQPSERTVEGMLAKTLKFILTERQFKILGAGRTDAKVSALDMAFELFLKGNPIADYTLFLELFNKNLPPDIRAISIDGIDETFNVIKDVKIKEYVYLFSYGEKNHPFCAPYLANILEDLDIGTMKKAAKLFEGTHDFSVYTVKSQKNAKLLRTIFFCELKKNTLLTANFFPEKSYALYVRGKGFMRYQIRMIMGALIQLGKGELSLNDIEVSLTENTDMQLTFVAPGSGLLLRHLEFETV